ncbi:MAG TPA: alkaline phosphatase family protein [Terriglobales bacterium]|nr:alkaline phosphatase family protein [Terriglobales bacterium]
MRFSLRAGFLIALWCAWLAGSALGSAYNAHPRLVVVIVIDQFRGDYLNRYHDQFGDSGFRLLMDHGAYFTNCNYDYATTSTAPGHATLFTGSYVNGHGILANEWWDPQKKRMVTSVEDDATRLVGVGGNLPGASPHNLRTDTLGDELKLATQGKSRVFGISLKDRAAILPAGFAADGAYWIDHKTGAWVTSTYYRPALPKWVQNFNASDRVAKYLNQDWKDTEGHVLRSTKPGPGQPSDFFDLVGPTPFANDYEFEFARELITYEKLGSGPATDLLAISLSANDLLGHEVGPDSPEMQAMAMALDRQLAAFFDFLGHEVGLADTWIALSADHGVAPVPSVAQQLRIPAAAWSGATMVAELNRALAARFSRGHPAEYVRKFDYPLVFLNEETFSSAHVKEEEAERAAGEALEQIGMRGFFTRLQLAEDRVPDTEMGRRYEHSYSPVGGWYVFAVFPPFTIEGTEGTTHGSPYSYDTHVPLAIYGLPFQPGVYRTQVEPVDLVATLASLLGINAPAQAVGRVLTEGLMAPRRPENPAAPPNLQSPAPPPAGVQPATLVKPGRGAP